MMIGRKLLCYFFVAFVSVYFFVASVGCSDDTSILDASKIRHIKHFADISKVKYKLETLMPIEAQKGLDSAIKQAAVWTPKASLILAFETAIVVSEEGKAIPILWTYRFINEPGTAWLGVVYGSNGIVDVMQKQMDVYNLKSWPSIQNHLQNIDWDEVNSKHTALFGIISGDAVIPVWSNHVISRDNSVNAETGKLIDLDVILEQLGKRASFYDSKTILNTKQGLPKRMIVLAGDRTLVSSW